MKQKPIIDVLHFQQAGVKSSLIVEFLTLYASEILPVPDQFKTLMLASDYLEAERLLHSFKGASEVVGAYRVSAIMQRLGKLIKTEDQRFDPVLLVEEFRLGVEATLVGVNKAIADLSPR